LREDANQINGNITACIDHGIYQVLGAVSEQLKHLVKERSKAPEI
jgi:hypothetical protein